jgi:hypothetical protein
MSPALMLSGRLCPDFYLRTQILEGRPQVNIVYVFFWPKAENEYAHIYRNDKRRLRNAFESNTCPVSAIDNIGLPNIKFYQAYPISDCSDSPSAGPGF